MPKCNFIVSSHSSLETSTFASSLSLPLSPSNQVPSPASKALSKTSSSNSSVSLNNFHLYPANRPILLPPDCEFSSVTHIKVPDLQPPVHLAILVIVMSHLNPHIYDDSWDQNDSSPPSSKPLHHCPNHISLFCKNLDTIKLHCMLNMFSTPEALFHESNALCSWFCVSCVFQNKIASFKTIPSIASRVQNLLPSCPSFSFYSNGNGAVPLGELAFLSSST